MMLVSALLIDPLLLIFKLLDNVDIHRLEY